MPVFLTLSDSNIFDPGFWNVQTVSADSTINANNVSDTIQIILTGNSITFVDTTDGSTFVVTDTPTPGSDAVLAGGSFSQIVEFRGNDADNSASGSVGLDSQGYIGGTGDDTFTDDGADGGQLRGGGGNDTLTGGTGNNQIRGGSGDDLLIGGSGSNNLRGGSGDDTLIGDQGSGNLIGGGGDDLIVTSLFTTFVNGGNGADSMVIPEGATFTPFSPGATGGTVTVTLPDGSTRNFTYTNIAAENITVACFAAGTRIATVEGQTRVEDLRAGDRIVTLGTGTKTLRWIGHRTVPAEGVFAPIRFATGTLDNDRPLLVSPEHRMLVQGWRCQLLFGKDEVLCAAKHLVDGDRITRAPRGLVTYFHLMFDTHQIVFANGAPAESLFMGDYQLSRDPELYEELLALFPELADRTPKTRRIAREPLRRFEATALQDVRGPSRS